MAFQSGFGHHASRALVASLAATALATPSALANDLRSPDARDAAVQAQHRRAIDTGGVRAPSWLSPFAGEAPTWTGGFDAQDLRSPDARDAARPVAPAPVPAALDNDPAHGFDWTAAGIGAAGGLALVVIAVAGATTVSGRFRPAPH